MTVVYNKYLNIFLFRKVVKSTINNIKFEEIVEKFVII